MRLMPLHRLRRTAAAFGRSPSRQRQEERSYYRGRLTEIRPQCAGPNRLRA